VGDRALFNLSIASTKKQLVHSKLPPSQGTGLEPGPSEHLGTGRHSAREAATSCLRPEILWRQLKTIKL